METTGSAAPLEEAGAGAVAAGAEPETFTLTCLNHQPLSGVCAYTRSVFGPADSELAGTTPLNPEGAADGLPSAAATSGRFCAKFNLASCLPPLPIGPTNTWTSSAPAQPCAVVSKNQPETVKETVGTVALAAGTSMNPTYALSPTALGSPVHSVAGSANVFDGNRRARVNRTIPRRMRARILAPFTLTPALLPPGRGCREAAGEGPLRENLSTL